MHSNLLPTASSSRFETACCAWQVAFAAQQTPVRRGKSRTREPAKPRFSVRARHIPALFPFQLLAIMASHKFSEFSQRAVARRGAPSRIALAAVQLGTLQLALLTAQLRLRGRVPDRWPLTASAETAASEDNGFVVFARFDQRR